MSSQKTAIVNSVGAIVILQSSIGNYSLSEIARIVEMNGSTVLGANVRPKNDDHSKSKLYLESITKKSTKYPMG